MILTCDYGPHLFPQLKVLVFHGVLFSYMILPCVYKFFFFYILCLFTSILSSAFLILIVKFEFLVLLLGFQYHLHFISRLLQCFYLFIYFHFQILDCLCYFQQP